MGCSLLLTFLIHACAILPSYNAFRHGGQRSLTSALDLSTSSGSNKGWGCNAVRGGIPRDTAAMQWHPCKCPHGQMMVGNDPECHKHFNRYYRPSHLKGKGCFCVSSLAYADAKDSSDCAKDDLDCHSHPLQTKDDFGCGAAVAGATSREMSAIRYDYCKCPRYFVVAGESQECQRKTRYFRTETLAGKNCSCKNAAFLGDEGRRLLEKIRTYSYLGQAVIHYLADSHLGQRSKTWEMIDDLVLPPDWIVQTPPGHLLGKPGSSMHFVGEPKKASGDSPEYDVDFGFLRCDNDTHCTDGFCHELKSTVQKRGDAPKKLCIGEADKILDTYYNEIISARVFVDIVSLTSPDQVGYPTFDKRYTRFLAAIRNAITYLSNLQDKVIIRLMFGNILVAAENTKNVVKELTRDVAKTSKLQVYVSAYNSMIDSWVHSKIVASDGTRLLQGGINFWTKDYLVKPPAGFGVHDLAMKAEGQVARSAHRHADILWKFVCSKRIGVSIFRNGNVQTRTFHPPWTKWPCAQAKKALWKARGLSVPKKSKWKAVKDVVKNNSKFKALKDRYRRHAKNSTNDVDNNVTDSASKIHDPEKSAPGATRMQVLARQLQAKHEAPAKKRAIPIARLGNIGPNPSDGAFQIMFMTAKTSIKISQQDLGPAASVAGEAMYGWLYLTALCNAMGRGVDVDMILSSPSDGHGYSNGYSADDVRTKLRRQMDGCAQSVSQHLRIVYIMGENTLSDGSAFSNHAKFFAIDDQVHYIGSQNLYNANLAEYGVIIDDANATKEILEQYWNKLWAQSAQSSIPKLYNAA